MVNFVKQVRAVMYKLEADSRIKSHHISLYWALFQTWNEYRFPAVMRIYRYNVMERARIHSCHTYARAMQQLAEWNYISYDPTVRFFGPSLVMMCRFDGPVNSRETSFSDQSVVPKNGTTCSTSADEIDDTSRDTTDATSGDTTRDTPNINSINNTNILNHENENEHSRPLSDFNCDFTHPVQTPDTEEKSNARGGGGRGADHRGGDGPEPRPASLDDVYNFFASLYSTRTEAEQFFHYYNSNGWKVGGKSDMYDWRESARGWLLKAKRFNPPSGPTPGSLASPGPQNYAEPL